MDGKLSELWSTRAYIRTQSTGMQSANDTHYVTPASLMYLQELRLKPEVDTKCTNTLGCHWTESWKILRWKGDQKTVCENVYNSLLERDSRTKLDNLSNCSLYFRGAGMAQWWQHSPPTNVAQVRFRESASYVGWVCWFPTLHREVFSGSDSGFPSPQKPTLDLICVDC